jgi:hypothetical protein
MAEHLFVNLLKSPGINSQPGERAYLTFRPHRARIRNPYKDPRNRFQGIDFVMLGIASWVPYKVYEYGFRLHSLAESIPWNRLKGSLDV